MEAYCVKCKEKREMNDALATFNAVGAPVTKGTCVVCGTKMNRMGRTEAHEGLTPPEKQPRKSRHQRKGKLVIVESPAKARTVGRFLGKGYTVKASVGHVRDLLKSQLSVDVENDFTPKYRVPNDKREVVKEIAAAAKKAEEIYLATDPDREGEAIAWHLVEAANIDPDLAKRVVFHEITDGAVAEAFGHPRDIDMDLVDAQQARRVLDRLVGYSLSPLLWQKVRGRLSAGRVQSVALRLIVEREREVENFEPVEYWSVDAQLKQEDAGLDDAFTARLLKIDNEDFELRSKDDTDAVVTDLEGSKYTVSKVKRSERRRKPAAPFTTSTLQQEASRKLGFTAKKTMRVAQQLYEGIDFGEGQTGLITYMRTDSTNISEVAQGEAREFVVKKYGADYVPETPPKYQTKSKSAQEAHEAVRPTSTLRTPKQMKEHLSRDQHRLYQLIWQRFLASQMSNAIYDTLSVDIEGKSADHAYLLRITGSSIKFYGFLKVYEESKDEDKKDNGELNIKIPASIAEGDLLDLLKVLPEQHFTQPPPRYSEATLVRTLEEYGIGRPSTYAPTLSTIQARGYVFREDKRLYPTDTGILVNDLLVEHFSDLFEYDFSAHMEEDLDEIAEGNREWHSVINDFYQTFEPALKHAQEAIPETKVEPEKVGRDCPECGHDLIIRWGRYGKFVSCSNFPECRYTEPWLEKIGVHCPECESGEVVLRRSRKGRAFYGCSNYPECQFTSWKRPIASPCPSCGGTLMIQNKKNVACIKCEETFPLDQFESGEESEL